MPFTRVYLTTRQYFEGKYVSSYSSRLFSCPYRGGPGVILLSFTYDITSGKWHYVRRHSEYSASTLSNTNHRC